jgi:hypothetical protein
VGETTQLKHATVTPLRLYGNVDADDDDDNAANDSGDDAVATAAAAAVDNGNDGDGDDDEDVTVSVRTLVTAASHAAFAKKRQHLASDLILVTAATINGPNFRSQKAVSSVAGVMQSLLATTTLAVSSAPVNSAGDVKWALNAIPTGE